MKAHIENTRRQLGELGAMAQKTEEAERDILARAEKREGEVSSRIEELRPKVHTDEAAATEYTELVDELGKLHTVIAKANQALTA